MTTQHHEQPQHFLEGKLEPECKNVQLTMECAALSMAISLKRIADELSFFNVYYNFDRNG